MTADPYVVAVAAYFDTPDGTHDGHVSSSDRREALTDLSSLVAELRARGASETEIRETLGPPPEYADRLLDALSSGPSTPQDPQARVLGVPVDLRGATDPQIRSRIWDPANSAILVPRLMGLGWTVNLGAVAVRLHLLRPDDEDAQTFDRVPQAAVAAARAAPIAISAATLAVLAARYRRLPRRVPIGWTVTGRPKQWADRRSLLAVAAFGAAPAIWAQLPSVPTADRLIRAARATTLATLSAATISAATISAATTPPEGRPARRVTVVFLAALPLSGLAAFLTLYLPVRAGLRAQWRAASTPSPGGAS